MAKKNQTKPNPQAAEKTKVENNSEESMSRNIVIAGLIIILLLAGIGFLIFGLVQSVTGDDSNDNDSDVETVEDQDDEADDDNDQASDSDIDDEDNDNDDDSDEAGDESDGDDSETDGNIDANGAASDEGDDDDSDEADSDEDSDSDEGEAADAGSRIGKYPATSVAYSRGNDYEFGDITGDNYVVKRGDTLWQIAEGRYGSGYAWVDIDKANGTFPLLANGQPNNIPVGYKLILPAID